MSDATLAAAHRRTAATNTSRTYGWVERAFHWTIAALIVTVAALGKVAYEWPYDTDAALGTKAALFSAHKTVGIATFLVALARIAWALAQPRPEPLHPERRLETFAASTVHWLLYGSLVLVPLLGWAHHATATGFAPIWWPFGQTLPGLPQDAALSAALAELHKIFVLVLAGAVALHVAGALKHALVDRDATLARMLRGTDPGPLKPAATHVLPALVAAVVWAAALGVGVARAPEPAQAAVVDGASAVEAASNWTVREGTLSITVAQLGQPVTGSFADWQAAIDFSEAAGPDGTHGSVEVAVATGSLTLGSVSAQATGDEFLSSGPFPTATFRADILPSAEAGADYVADGALEIRGVAVPVRLPFTLEVDGDAATMAGTVPVDRRDFGMGESYPDEASVGFPVAIDVALTAERAE